MKDLNEYIIDEGIVRSMKNWVKKGIRNFGRYMLNKDKKDDDNDNDDDYSNKRRNATKNVEDGNIDFTCTVMTDNPEKAKCDWSNFYKDLQREYKKIKDFFAKYNKNGKVNKSLKIPNIDLLRFVCHIAIAEEKIYDLNFIKLSPSIKRLSFVICCEKCKKIDISKWNVSNVEEAGLMILFCPNLENIGDVSKWNFRKMKITNKNYEIIRGCPKLKPEAVNNDKFNYELKENLNMESLINYINKELNEALRINKDTIKNIKNSNIYYNNITSLKTHTSKGKEYLWFTIYKMLCDEGPMSKKEVLTKLGLEPTSYSNSFAKWHKRNIIVPSKGKLEAKPEEEWNINK